ncbi:MAG: RNA methyltransferase [Chloroflexi bacterium]|nr:RNA methyltransferase [Ktedonobacteraceae bacterium]MBV9019986.1 RNA methyltransferase [Ktedonobacteraceae bacterium]MBV9707131.1 RNA methyltransferase [Chloroflexota bacterium]
MMEGPHLLEALLDAQLLPHEVYYQPELLQRTSRGKLLRERLAPLLGQEQCIAVNERVIEALGDVQTSQGVVSVLSLAAFTASQVRARRPKRERHILLILDDIADPGNMGTMLRIALAVDVDAVLLTAHCVDCYSPKVVRSAAGAHIALPIETDVSWPTIAEKIEPRYRVLAAETAGARLYYEQDLTLPFALIIGNEAHGLSAQAHTLASQTITIPLSNNVESLNAAMAAGIILYEAVRQTRMKLKQSTYEE